MKGRFMINELDKRSGRSVNGSMALSAILIVFFFFPVTLITVLVAVIRPSLSFYYTSIYLDQVMHIRLFFFI